MERLINGKPGLHESWQELAEHSLTHDDLGSPEKLAAQQDGAEPCPATC
jgi:hypothetical protein